MLFRCAASDLKGFMFLKTAGNQSSQYDSELL